MEQNNFIQFNIYVYCLNNPTRNSDSSGKIVTTTLIFATVTSAVVNCIKSYTVAMAYGEEFSVYDGFLSLAVGSLSVLTATCPIPIAPIVDVVGSALIDIFYEKKSWQTVLTNSLTNAIFSLIPLEGETVWKDIIIDATFGMGFDFLEEGITMGMTYDYENDEVKLKKDPVGPMKHQSNNSPWRKYMESKRPLSQTRKYKQSYPFSPLRKYKQSYCY